MCSMIWFFDGMFVKNPMKHVRLVLIIREPYFKNVVKNIVLKLDYVVFSILKSTWKFMVIDT